MILVDFAPGDKEFSILKADPEVNRLHLILLCVIFGGMFINDFL